MWHRHKPSAATSGIHVEGGIKHKYEQATAMIRLCVHLIGVPKFTDQEHNPFRYCVILQ